MTHDELQSATDLCLVRQMRNIMDMLDADVGPVILDEEHAQVRRVVRTWEQRLADQVKVRKPRATKEPPMFRKESAK